MDFEGSVWLGAAALWATGFLLWPKLRRCAGGGIPGERPSVSIIIPARNEEHNLATLLRSLALQAARPREVIVVDDGSTDRTAAVARDLGATLLSSQPLPEGWRGKTWACQQGAQLAAGELLLFVDADTWFESDGLQRILQGYTGGAFSAGPYHAIRKPFENLSLFFNLNMVWGTVPRGLFGQMLLVNQASYRQVGGHAAVKGFILEHYRLATCLRAAGVPVRSVAGRGALSFRMYPNGLRELIEGWTKAFASGAARTPRATLALVVAWMVGLMLAPLGCVAGGDRLAWLGLYCLCASQVGWFSRQVGAFHGWSALLYPLPLVFFFALLARSATRSGREVHWKGRRIHGD